MCHSDLKRIKMQKNCRHYRDNGFTLMEICVALFILGIAIAPMLNAFSPALTTTDSVEETMVFTNQARKTLNRVLALD